MSTVKPKNKAVRFIMSVLCVISFILTVFLGTASFVLGILRTNVLNADFYASVVSTPEYSSELKTRIDKSLKEDCGVYGFPYDRVEGEITEEKLTQIAVEYARSFFDSQYNISDLKYPSEGILEAIKQYGKEDGEDTLYADEKNALLLTEKLTDRIVNTISSVSSQPLVQSVSSKVFKSAKLGYLSSLLPFFVFATATFAVLTFVFKKGSLGLKLYISASAVMTVGTLCFAPALLIKLSDIPSRAALGDCYLRQFFLAVTNGLTDRTYSFALVLFIVSSVLLFVSSVLYVVCKKKENNSGI